MSNDVPTLDVSALGRASLPLASMSLALRSRALPGAVSAAPRGQAAAPRGPLNLHPSLSQATITLMLPRDAAAGNAASKVTETRRLRHAVWFVPALAAHLLSRLTIPREPAHTGALFARSIFPSMLPRKALIDGGRQGPAAAGGRKPALVWFRSDLRLHDHEPLHAALQEGTSLLAVYCFDPQDYRKGPFGHASSGPARTRFILESVTALRQYMRNLGGELIVRIGRPESVLPSLVRAYGLGTVHCYGEVSLEDCQVEARVCGAVEAEGAVLRTYWGGTLHHKDDLPFTLGAMPKSFADFHKHVSSAKVRALVPTPSSIKGLPLGGIEAGCIPTMQQLGFAAAEDNCLLPSSTRLPGSKLRGGESEALRLLAALLMEVKNRAHAAASSCCPSNQRDSHAALQDAQTFAGQLSPWLAFGCLSPRQVFFELKRLTLGPGEPDTTPSARAGQATELLWSEFFRFLAKRNSESTMRAGRGAGQGRYHAAAAIAAA